MIKDVINFNLEGDMDFAIRFVKSVCDSSLLYQYSLKLYASQKEIAAIFKRCEKSYPLSDAEKSFMAYVNEHIAKCGYNILQEYQDTLHRLQQAASDISSTECIWAPVLYPILAEMLYCCYMNMMDRYSESRDKNLDIYSAKQVIVSMPSVLREITALHHTLMLSSMRKEIKKGYMDVVGEFVFARKYYYIDLNGKKHTNFNSEAKRDKAVEDYINKLYTEFSENGDGMLAMVDNIERRLSGYSVYDKLC